MSSDARVRRRWTAEEDEQLRKEVTSQLMQRSRKDWNQIAAKLLGRTNKDCRKRWLKVHKTLQRGPWDGKEDERLRQGIQLFGFRWTKVAKVVETRHADQCARRWQHSLDPSIDHSVWKEEEDKRLLNAVQRYGHNWATISENDMPLRSATDVRNRYMLIARKSQRKKGSPASVQENTFRKSSPTERTSATESDSDAGESENIVIEEGTFCESPSLALSLWTSSEASPAAQLISVQQSASSSISFPDLNYHGYTTSTPTMDPTAVMPSTPWDCRTSAQDPMRPFPVSQTTSTELFEPFFGADSAAPRGVDWASYAYDAFGTPISGAAYSIPLRGQDSVQAMASTTRSPMRATLILDASSSALSDVLETLLNTNTKFTIETNH